MLRPDMVPAAGMPQVSLLYIITPFWEVKNIKLLSFLYTKPIPPQKQPVDRFGETAPEER